MQEVQRFNKVLKSFVLLGDIILLNLLLWMVTSIWENRSPFEYFFIFVILLIVKVIK